MADISILERHPAVDSFYISTADQVTILGDGTTENPLRASGLGSSEVVQSSSPGTGNAILTLEAGKTNIRVTPDDEFLQIKGITPPADFPDGGIISVENLGEFSMLFTNNSNLAPEGSRVFFRAATGNGYGVNGHGGFNNGHGIVQLVYHAGVGWFIVSPTGIAP